MVFFVGCALAFSFLFLLIRGFMTWRFHAPFDYDIEPDLAVGANLSKPVQAKHANFSLSEGYVYNKYGTLSCVSTLVHACCIVASMDIILNLV